MADGDSFNCDKVNESSCQMSEMLTDSDISIINLINRRKKSRQRCDLDAIVECSDLQRDIIIASVDRLVECGFLMEGVYAGKATYSVVRTVEIQDEVSTNKSNESFIDKCLLELHLKNIKDQITKEMKDFCEQQIKQFSVVNPTNTKLGNNLITNDFDDRLLETLKEENRFLREEIGNKNSVINILLENLSKRELAKNPSHASCFNSHQHNSETNFETNQFQFPKQYARRNIEALNTPNFIHDNRYNNLPTNYSITDNNCQETIKHYKVHKKDDKQLRSNANNKINHQRNNRFDNSISIQNNKKTITTDKQSTNNANNTSKNKKITCILGDSMIKGINGYKLTNSLGYNDPNKIIIKSFSGATTEDMHEYVKPTIKKKPDNIILHVGTNDLSQNTTTEEIAKNIINLAASIYQSNINVTISGLIPRNDNLSVRCDELNDYLNKMCSERNIGYINHYNYMDKNQHLNRSQLHLNKHGTVTLANSFLNFISKD